jgi:hypothetical protein
LVEYIVELQTVSQGRKANNSLPASSGQTPEEPEHSSQEKSFHKINNRSTVFISSKTSIRRDNSRNGSDSSTRSTSSIDDEDDTSVSLEELMEEGTNARVCYDGTITCHKGTEDCRVRSPGDDTTASCSINSELVVDSDDDYDHSTTSVQNEAITSDIENGHRSEGVGVSCQDEVEESDETLLLPRTKNLHRYSHVPNCCAICLERYECGQTVAWSPNQHCSHAYHQDCIIVYILARKSTEDEGTVPCPTCRECFIVVPKAHAVMDVVEKNEVDDQQR